MRSDAAAAERRRGSGGGTPVFTVWPAWPLIRRLITQAHACRPLDALGSLPAAPTHLQGGTLLLQCRSTVLLLQGMQVGCCLALQLHQQQALAAAVGPQQQVQQRVAAG